MRVAYQNTAEFQHKGFDFIIVARSRINGKTSDIVTEDFVGALKKLGIWKNEDSIT